MFKVVSDQLKISDGWVRCGHCADVFDATLYLDTLVAPAPWPETPDGAAQIPAEPPEASNPPVAPDARDSDFHADLRQFATGASVTVPDIDLGDAPPDAPETGNQMPVSDMVVATTGKVEPHPEPSFVRQARRRAFWRSPGMRAMLSVLALLLTLMLAGQWGLHERDRLAALQPGLAPVLSRLCAPLGCKVASVRRIDAIVIDSATLVRRLGNFYSFDLVLKNTAPMELAVPALELSLTDTRDAVIARRVFLPEELPGAPGLLPAQGSITVSLRLSLAVGDAMPMAGYRALVFYP